MNNRIKELAEQAGVPMEYSFAEKATVWNMHQSLERFAKSIIEECGDVAINHICKNDGSFFTIPTVFKEHFGVEE